VVSPPSGRQVVLGAGDHSAVVVEVGGGLRTYRAGDMDILDGYGDDEMCSSGRGQPLIPWPNRLAGGRYVFAGTEIRAAVDEPATGAAIHGLTRWRSWEVVADGRNRAVASLQLRPSPGYPFDLHLQITYVLDGGGLSATTVARNDGHRPCPVALGFHPYLAAFGGLVDDLDLCAPGGVRYLADGCGIPTGTVTVDGSEWDFRDGRGIGERLLDTAFTSLRRDGSGRATVILADGSAARRVSVWMDSACTHLMIFTGDTVSDPARRRRGLAVEPMTAAPDAFNTGDGLRVLEPGQRLEATWGITPG